MNNPFKVRIKDLLLFFFITVIASCSQHKPAGPSLDVGQRINNYNYSDQFDKQHQLSEDTNWIILSRNKTSSDHIKLVLDEFEVNFLAQKNIVYIADISGMPSIITRVFALPSLRELTYPVLLDYDGNRTSELPSNRDMVSLIQLDNYIIKSIDFLNHENDLRQRLQSLP